jgi:uncharacterized protein YegP (UPF0339 family)
MYFVLYKDNRGVSSEGYTSKQGALHGIALVEQGASGARIYDDTTKTWL